MIIRKPYAFFIKYFRLFHIVFFLISLGLLVSTITLSEFLSKYLETTPAIISSYEIDSVNISYFWPIVLIVGLLLVMGILIYKKKSIKLYIFQIISYIFVLVLFIVAQNYLAQLTTHLVDVRILKALQDFLFVACILEAICVALLFVRTTGFDIKNFGFEKEYSKMMIDEKDREEVEVSFDFDIDFIKTKINRFKRNFKYFYLENKIVFLVVCACVVASIGIGIYSYIKLSSKVYLSSDKFSSSRFKIEYNGLYVDDKNLKNTPIDENANFVILKFSVSAKGNSNISFGMSTLSLLIDNKTYSANEMYNKYFSDFGKGYNGELVDNKLRDYYLVYSIPGSLSLDDVKILYTDLVNRNTTKYLIRKVDDLIDLRNERLIGTYAIGDNVSFDNTVVSGVSLLIKDVAFDKSFFVPYVFKVNSKNYSSGFYVSPSISGNYDKAVIRMNTNDCGLVEKYGIIYYGKDKKYNKSKVVLKQIDTTRTTGYCFFETEQNILSASDILLVMDIRGMLYNYYLR